MTTSSTAWSKQPAIRTRHPSGCTWLLSDRRFEPRRGRLLDEYLRDFDAADAEPAKSEVATQKLIPAKRRVVQKYPVADGETDPTHMVGERRRSDGRCPAEARPPES